MVAIARTRSAYGIFSIQRSSDLNETGAIGQNFQIADLPWVAFCALIVRGIAGFAEGAASVVSVWRAVPKRWSREVVGTRGFGLVD